MAKRKYNNIIILILFAAYIVYYKFFLLLNAGNSSNLPEFVNVAAITIFAFIAILLLGFRKDRLTGIKKSILIMTISEILIFFAISYGLGIVTGFLENSYALDTLSIIQNICTPILFVIAIEIFRYTMLNANSDKIIVVYVTTILITLLELTIGLNNVTMYNFETTFRTISAIILPIIIKNASLSYLTINGGLKPVLFYRLVMDIYGYVMPVVPDLGDYITSVMGILLPTLIYMYSSRMVDEYQKESEEKYTKKTLKLSDVPLILFIVILVGLISGRFTYSIIGVGSESMTPKIDKGDAVVYKRVKSTDIKVGDILVFNSGSKMIIHRLVDIKEDGNTVYYVTKGDANNGPDNLNLTIENIKGKVLFKVKYIAYPSLWLKDMIEKE